jgi:hypothetical protein
MHCAKHTRAAGEHQAQKLDRIAWPSGCARWQKVTCPHAHTPKDLVSSNAGPTQVHPLSYDYNATAQIAAAVDLPNLRLFQVGRQWSNDAGFTIPLGCHANGTAPPLLPGCAGRNQWAAATEGAASFSAVCYLTAQELMRTELGTDVAVGLVESDWGGSTEETWQTRGFASSYGCPTGTSPLSACPINETQLSPIRNDSWGCLYRGMIEPLTRSLRPELMLWYQGEANSVSLNLLRKCLAGGLDG